MITDPALAQFLSATLIIETGHPAVQAYANEHAGNSNNDVDIAVNLYYAVRDGIRYNPYDIVMTVDGLKATTTLADRQGWCTPKAVLLASACRIKGIPARLGFADVRNHLSTERLRKRLNTDVFYWHSYTSIYLNDTWVKATPAFNIELCEKFRLHSLEFDGLEDSIYHPYDLDGNQHMEYLRFHGEYADVPIDEMVADFNKYYAYAGSMITDADFDEDVEREVRQ